MVMIKVRLIRFAFVLIWVAGISSLAAAKGKDWYMGGRVAYTVPTNIGKNYEKGFADMSTNGGQVAFFGRWMYNKQLSLGWDLGYQLQSGDQDYWDIDRRGKVSVSYQTIQLLAEGNYYFNNSEIRPYVGIAFGGFWLNNKRQFDSYDELVKPSGTYDYSKLIPGLAPQIGLVIELGETSLLDIHARFALMPNLEEEFVDVEYLGQVSTNPHGAQNHLSFSIGFLF